MKLKFDSLTKALFSLEELILVTQGQKFTNDTNTVIQRGVRDGVIQNFEFSYELCWKFMQRYLEKNIGTNYVKGLSKKGLFLLAEENGLIDNVEQWQLYHQARNLTSHVYDKRIADKVFSTALVFLNDAKQLLKNLEERND